MQNYFTWRKAVVEAAKNEGMDQELLNEQSSEFYQHMYFDEQMSAEAAAKHLADLDTAAK